MGKASVEEIANRYLNKKEEKKEVVEIVDRCIQKGYDYEKMKDRVLNAIADAHKAHKIISAVCEEFPQLRKRTRFEESKEDKKDVKRERFSENTREKENGDRDNRDKDRGDRSRDSRRESRRDETDGKEREREARRKLTQKMHDRQKTEEVAQTQSHSTGTPVTEEHLRAKELMYKAQQEIEERKKALGLAAVSVAPGQMPATVNVKKIALQPKEAQMFMNFSMEKKSRVEELKAKLSKVPTSIQNLVNKQPVMTPLPAEVAKPLAKQVVKEEAKSEEMLVEFLDPRIDARSSERKKRAFNFHQPGQHIQEANKQRAQAKLNKLQQEVSAAAASTGISSAVKLAMVTPKSKKADEIPDIEWWDAVVLDRPNYDEIPDGKDEDRYAETVSDLGEHPISLPPPTEPLAPTFLKVYLTTKERKKIRRQNRKEMQKEQTEKIRLGLMKPPEPKVKISNLMRVLGSDAIQDPTKMEAHVKKQMAERVKKHEQANAERKLTTEQKAAKKTKKISEDTSIAVHVTVYRIKSLMNPAHKFKVEKNAKQLQMTGVIMLHRALNVVVVEGGPKQQKFYKNLLLNRIKWSDEIIGQKKAAKGDEPGERNSCQLIWEGMAKRRAFRDFQIVTATLDKQAREYFEKHAVAQYWDLSYSTTVLLEGQA
ncbi:hypothetical protein WR25_10760 [Diploscapter pachys]|uniref:Uncharacterized protein n=1 Tax=Diploscapter pachys TaxID=2018661 RepID=A0A2A2JBR4_9BILA|nr:hypothetical protein WR25_10760 [Diploscapter pachys]